MRKSAYILCLVATLHATIAGADERPNIVLIVADDLGFSDLGAYGGEIRTPHLDALAASGLLLTNYHTSPTCGPTRAMLMTGVDHHRAGVGTNAAALLRMPELRKRAGYEGFLNDSVVAFPRLLQDAGYHTFMTGKWDLATRRKPPSNLPTDRGFDRFFGVPGGGPNHFSDAIGAFRPTADTTYYEDETPLDALPDDFYSSAHFTNRLIDYIRERPDDGAPYFAYLALTAPHWPLQVPDDWIDRYRGAYDAGWDVIREQRYRRIVELGLLPESTILPEQNRAVPDWDTLLPAQRQVELRRMELYAAMVELMDHHIGRLLDVVRDEDDRETVVVFVSDNGAEANDIEGVLDNKYWIPATFDNRLENMGRRGSYVWLGVGWGQATSSPLRIYKSYTTEGGIRAPAIVYSTRNRFTPGLKTATVAVRDLAPTMLSLAEVTHPGSRYEGRDIIAPSGRSALSYLEGASDDVHAGAPIGFELYGNRALIKGRWKTVLTWPPEGNGRWELYDLETDPSETRNLAHREPNVLREMVDDWERYAERNGVVILERDTGYGRYPEAGR